MQTMHPSNTRMRTAIAALLIAALPGPAVAQQRSDRPGRNLDEMMLELTEQLELDEEQAGQMRVLLAAQNEQSRRLIEEARASGQGRTAFGAMRERMTELREATDAKIKTVLSPEQMAEYEQIVARRRTNRRRSRRSGEGAGGSRGI